MPRPGARSGSRRRRRKRKRRCAGRGARDSGGPGGARVSATLTVLSQPQETMRGLVADGEKRTQLTWRRARARKHASTQRERNRGVVASLRGVVASLRGPQEWPL